MDKKDYDGAKADCAKMIELKPDEGQYYYIRGLAEIHLKQKADACTDFNTAKDKGFAGAQAKIDKYCKDVQQPTPQQH